MTIDFGVIPPAFWPMLIFCIGIYFITSVVRTIAEVKFPALTESKAWTKILRSVPPILGGVVAVVMNKYPFLDTLPTWGTRFVYGCFGGGLASFAYLVLKAAVQKFFGVTVARELGTTDPPPAPEAK